LQHLGELPVVAAQADQRRAPGPLVTDAEEILGCGVQVDYTECVVQEDDAG